MVGIKPFGKEMNPIPNRIMPLAKYHNIHIFKRIIKKKKMRVILAFLLMWITKT